MRRSALSRNHYFVFGILVGLALSFYLPEDVWDLVQKEECPQEAAENSLIEKFGEEFEPHLNLISKPLAAKKPVSVSDEDWKFKFKLCTHILVCMCKLYELTADFISMTVKSFTIRNIYIFLN